MPDSSFSSRRSQRAAAAQASWPGTGQLSATSPVGGVLKEACLLLADRVFTLRESLEQRDIVQPVLDLFQANVQIKCRIRRRFLDERNAVNHFATFDTILDLFDKNERRPGARVNFETKRLKDLFSFMVPQSSRYSESTAKDLYVVVRGHREKLQYVHLNI
jgi:hypothetical protein